jgi:hypothetical protein
MDGHIELVFGVSKKYLTWNAWILVLHIKASSWIDSEGELMWVWVNEWM